jgi:hypothetical protein
MFQLLVPDKHPWMDDVRHKPGIPSFNHQLARFQACRRRMRHAGADIVAGRFANHHLTFAGTPLSNLAVVYCSTNLGQFAQE